MESRLNRPTCLQDNLEENHQMFLFEKSVFIGFDGEEFKEKSIQNAIKNIHSYGQASFIKTTFRKILR